MNISQACRYLGLKPAAVLDLAQKREIPAVKLGSTWRFSRRVLDDWLAAAAERNVARSPKPKGVVTSS